MNENIKLKIYWVVTVWAKWQIIIPKECRVDLDILVWSKYSIADIEQKAFALWINIKNICKENLWFKLEEIWEVSIWSKYQFVIPSTLRKDLGISVWDNLITIWKEKKWLWFIKNDNIDFLFEYIKENM